MLKPTGLERASVRAAFNQRRDPDQRADFLLREVERRMLERLDIIRLEDVGRVLDVGCGLGQSLAPLAVRFPGAQMIGADLAEKTLAAAAGRPGSRERLRAGARRWLARLGVGGGSPLPATEPLWLATDAHALALAPNSIDIIWSNLTAHWFDDPLAAIAEWQRVIRPKGLVMFSAFGVDTLREVRGRRQSGATGLPNGAAPDPSHVHSPWPTFQDMHDWGDALTAAGFADPVLDTERLTLTYQDAERFRADAASLAMLTGDPVDNALDAALEAGAGAELTIELVYGHAWCPAQKRRADGLPVVQLHRPSAKL